MPDEAERLMDLLVRGERSYAFWAIKTIMSATDRRQEQGLQGLIEDLSINDVYINSNKVTLTTWDSTQCHQAQKGQLKPGSHVTAIEKLRPCSHYPLELWAIAWMFADSLYVDHFRKELRSDELPSRRCIVDEAFRDKWEALSLFSCDWCANDPATDKDVNLQELLVAGQEYLNDVCLFGMYARAARDLIAK